MSGLNMLGQHWASASRPLSGVGIHGLAAIKQTQRRVLLCNIGQGVLRNLIERTRRRDSDALTEFPWSESCWDSNRYTCHTRASPPQLVNRVLDCGQSEEESVGTSAWHCQHVHDFCKLSFSLVWDRFCWEIKINGLCCIICKNL